jgi:hypothetical protein
MTALLRRLASLACAVALALALAQGALANGLSRVQRGMPDDQVRDLVGMPTSTNHYPTGKGWIPVYGWWGGDAYRTEWIYKGKGRVVFNQKPFSSRLRVINVVSDASEDGY